MKWYRISGKDEFKDELDCLVEALDSRDLLRVIENNDYLSNSKIHSVRDELVDGTIPSERWGWWWLCDIRFYPTEIDEEKWCRYLIQAQDVEEVSHKVKEQVREQIGPCGIDGLQRLKLGSVLRRDEVEDEEKQTEMKELKVTDLRIGDKVELKYSGFEMEVVGVLWGLESPLTEATLYLDFVGNDIGVQEYSLDEVELIQKVMKTSKRQTLENGMENF